MCPMTNHQPTRKRQQAQHTHCGHAAGCIDIQFSGWSPHKNPVLGVEPNDCNRMHICNHKKKKTTPLSSSIISVYGTSPETRNWQMCTRGMPMLSIAFHTA